MRNLNYYKMIKYIRIIFIALLIIPVQAYAQQASCTVSGRVIDGMSSPVAYASVAVYKDNSPLTGTITNHDGKFSLKLAQGADSCQLVVEFIGYSKVSQEFVSDKSQLNQEDFSSGIQWNCRCKLRFQSFRHCKCSLCL